MTLLGNVDTEAAQRLYLAARETLHWVDNDGWHAYPAKCVWECLVGLPDDEAIEVAREIVKEFESLHPETRPERSNR